MPLLRIEPIASTMHRAAFVMALSTLAVVHAAWLHPPPALAPRCRSPRCCADASSADGPSADRDVQEQLQQQFAADKGLDEEVEKERRRALVESAAEELARERRVNLGLAVASPLFAAALFFGQRTVSVDPIALLARMEEQSPALPAALSNGRPTVVEFYAPWCTSCKEAAPCMYRLEKLYAEQLNFVVIDGNDARNSDLVQKFGVDGIPHLALISGQRKLVGTLIGAIPNAVLEANMKALAAGNPLPRASTNAEYSSLGG